MQCKTQLSNLVILYIEDDISTRESMYTILIKLFKNVFIAENGEEGFNVCIENKNHIDIIVSDINMPKLSGIGMIKKIREYGLNIPVIFSSAYQESSFLLEAIKLNISDYLVKPYNIRHLLSRIENICNEIRKQHLINRQQKELNQYLELIDKVAIISKTDIEGKITFVNDIFCQVSGFSREEIIGKPHNIMWHPDMPTATFNNLWETISQGEIWKGKIKNRSKDNNSYYVTSTVIPMFDPCETIIGYMGIRFITTQEETEKREFRKKVIDNIKECKEREVKLNNEIKFLKQKSQQIAHIHLIQHALEEEKKKSLKQHSQLLHFEDKLKKEKENFDKLRHDSYNKFIGLNSELKNLFSLKKIFEDKYKESSVNIEVRDAEIVKLKVRIEEQNKTILNLKDVIAFREHQLKYSLK
ncbi:MAG: response regulator [Arcobacteraceae bacterium]